MKNKLVKSNIQEVYKLAPKHVDAGFISKQSGIAKITVYRALKHPEKAYAKTLYIMAEHIGSFYVICGKARADFTKLGE